ncbi:unnamed protein product [Cylicocyclus nassatus]|uniref:Uncharacterized protein n=1 Tax=Cylicocyclus nassatus TaxID=53992 RepID=A0AA36M455_CYLNA|nr:unnamed protein product [Cylicocyclus nassatus]
MTHFEKSPFGADEDQFSGVVVLQGFFFAFQEYFVFITCRPLLFPCPVAGVLTMSIDLKQNLDVIDYFVLEEWGYNHKVHMRMGPHRPSVVARSVRHPIKVDNGL